MKLNFTKMEGLGNDYVYVNCLKETVENPAELSRRISDRHFGIGSDGLILIKPSDMADFTMDMYNADGSQSEMCGNGIRCVGKYVYDYGLTDKEEVSVETLAGIKHLRFRIRRETPNDRGTVESVTVNMGAPILEPGEIPVRLKDAEAYVSKDKREGVKACGVDPDRAIVNAPVTVNGAPYRITCVSMGNPHCISFVDSVDTFDLDTIGPQFEENPMFPRRVNAEFVELVNREYVKMRVWERGTGETLACGTGACASVVACILNGLTEDEVTIRLLGGELTIRWDRGENTVYMTGPAKVVFDGTIEI